MITARVSMLLKSRASPDMLPFSLCNKKRLTIRHMNRPPLSNDTINSVLRHREIGFVCLSQFVRTLGALETSPSLLFASTMFCRLTFGAVFISEDARQIFHGKRVALEISFAELCCKLFNQGIVLAAYQFNSEHF